MALSLSRGDVIKKLIVDGDELEFVFPPMSDELFKQERMKLLEMRYAFDDDGTYKNQAYETRFAFFDKTCRGVRGKIELGDVVLDALNDQTNPELLSSFGLKSWKDAIDLNIKSEVASQFEEAALRIRKKIKSD